MVCLIFLFLANFYFMIIRISKQFPFHKSLKVNTININEQGMTCSCGVSPVDLRRHDYWWNGAVVMKINCQTNYTLDVWGT